MKKMNSLLSFFMAVWLMSAPVINEANASLAAQTSSQSYNQNMNDDGSKPAAIYSDIASEVDAGLGDTEEEKKANEETEKAKGVAQQVLQGLQMGWSVVKLIQNAVEAEFAKEFPHCTAASVALQIIGYASMVSLATRLINMVMNATKISEILDDMELLVFSEDKKPRPSINMSQFYELMVREYSEYTRYAFAEILADPIDLLGSTAEMVVIVIELFVPYATDCPDALARP